jgi:MoxR-like ATPase
VATPEEILKTIGVLGAIRVEDALLDYINKIVRTTRQWPAFHLGASPRAGIALMQTSGVLAGFRGRDFAIPDDVVELVLPALRHRVQLTAEAEVEGRTVDQELESLLRSIEVPRS